MKKYLQITMTFGLHSLANDGSFLI